MTCYWKTRRKHPGAKWDVEIHDTLDDLRESMESQMGDGWELNVMSVDECINDEERRIRKFGIGDIHIAVANLNLLCDKLVNLYGSEESRILEYDSGYTGHRNEIEALHYAARTHWPDLDHKLGEVETTAVGGEAVVIVLDKDEAAHRGDCD